MNGRATASIRRYSGSLPHRRFYATCNMLGIVLLWLSPALLLMLWAVQILHLGYLFPQPTIPQWYHFAGVVPLFIVGALLRMYPGQVYRTYYCRVYQGRVVHKDVEGKGKYKVYLLTIRGNTRANEMRLDTHPVSQYLWEQTELNDIVQLQTPL